MRMEPKSNLAGLPPLGEFFMKLFALAESQHQTFKTSIARVRHGLFSLPTSTEVLKIKPTF